MSEQQTQRGKFKEIDLQGKTIEEYCEGYCISRGINDLTMEDRLIEKEAIKQLTIKELMKHCMEQCRKFPNKRAGYEHYIFLQLLKNTYPRDIEDYIIDYSLMCRGELEIDY